MSLAGPSTAPRGPAKSNECGILQLSAVEARIYEIMMRQVFCFAEFNILFFLLDLEKLRRA